MQDERTASVLRSTRGAGSAAAGSPRTSEAGEGGPAPSPLFSGGVARAARQWEAADAGAGAPLSLPALASLVRDFMQHVSGAEAAPAANGGAAEDTGATADSASSGNHGGVPPAAELEAQLARFLDTDKGGAARALRALAAPPTPSRTAPAQPAPATGAARSAGNGGGASGAAPVAASPAAANGAEASAAAGTAGTAASGTAGSATDATPGAHTPPRAPPTDNDGPIISSPGLSGRLVVGGTIASASTPRQPQASGDAPSPATASSTGAALPPLPRLPGAGAPSGVMYGGSGAELPAHKVAVGQSLDLVERGAGGGTGAAGMAADSGGGGFMGGCSIDDTFEVATVRPEDLTDLEETAKGGGTRGTASPRQWCPSLACQQAA